jgi:hypothetical protein
MLELGCIFLKPDVTHSRDSISWVTVFWGIFFIEDAILCSRDLVAKFSFVKTSGKHQKARSDFKVGADFYQLHPGSFLKSSSCFNIGLKVHRFFVPKYSRRMDFSLSLNSYLKKSFNLLVLLAPFSKG